MSNGDKRPSNAKRIYVGCILAVLVGLTMLVYVNWEGVTGLIRPRIAAIATPIPVPGLALEGYKGTALQTLCLQVEQSYSPPLESASASPSLPVEDNLRDILEGLGMEVVDASTPCDGCVKVSLVGRSQGGKYCPGTTPSLCDNPKFCYNGGSIQVSKELVIGGETVHADRYEDSWEPQGSVITGCLEQPSVTGFYHKWEEDMVDWLVELWGPRVYGHVLVANIGGVTGETLRGVRPDPALISELVELLIAQEENVRRPEWSNLAGFLGYMGSQAMDAVPALIRGGNAVEWAGRSGAAAWTALESITGQSFGSDGQAWQDWWDEQN